MTTCYLCGHDGADTTEHVIPRCLYVGKLPPDVITLRAHERCNKFTEKDEEAFRNHISAGIPPDNPGHGLWEKTWKAIHRPQARGMQADFYGKMLTRLELDSGGVLRKAPVAARMKDHRVHRVLAKVISGLYAWQRHEILPPARVRWHFGQADDDQSATLSLPVEFAVHDVVRVRWGYADDEPRATIWVVGFYETAWFWCSTMPHQKASLSKRKRGIRMTWPTAGSSR